MSKARKFFRALEDEQALRAAAKELWGWRLLKGSGVLAAVGLVGAAAHTPVGLCLLLALPAAAIGAANLYGSYVMKKFPKPAGGLEVMIARFADDWHPDHPILAILDTRNPEDVASAERTRLSPHSWAQKKYYRAANTRFTGVLADGTVLAFQKYSLSKTKRGAVIRRTIQIKGRLMLPRALKPGMLERARTFGAVRAIRSGTNTVLFWGTIQHLEAWPLDLARLFEHLRER